MNHTNIITLGLSAFIILILSGALVAAIGIGIAPNEIKISSALRGTEYDRPLTVFNTGDSANNYSLTADGEAGGWISFYELSDKEAPVNLTSIDGKSKRSLLVRFSVPDDAPSGTYSAIIYAKTVPDGVNKTENVVAAVLMARTFAELNVTGEQVVDGLVNTVTIESTEPGYPLRIGASFKNTGNVVANPEISVSITKDGEVISSFVSGDARVKPSATETIVAEWNTTSEDAVGDYAANVMIFLDEKKLASESIPFKILPVGTFTRQGNFTKLEILDEPAVGAAVRVDSYFKNTGRIDTLAKFSGEAYRDGTRIDVISSDELSVGVGREMPLASYLKLSSSGNYTVRGRIVYSGKETEAREISFSVPESKSDNSAAAKAEPQAWSLTGMVAGFGGINLAAIVVVLALILAALIVRRKYSKGTDF